MFSLKNLFEFLFSHIYSINMSNNTIVISRSRSSSRQTYHQRSESIGDEDDEICLKCYYCGHSTNKFYNLDDHYDGCQIFVKQENENKTNIFQHSLIF
jgi:hypothetical protein